MINNLLNWLVARQIRPVLVNWKTTLLGISALIPSLRAIIGDIDSTISLLIGVADGGALDLAQLKLLVGGIGSIIGTALVFAKDGNKSTETSTGETPPRAVPQP